MPASYTNQSKSADSFATVSKSSTAYTSQSRTGSPWTYNQAGLTYNAAFDPLSGNAVYYNYIGSRVAYATLSKS